MKSLIKIDDNLLCKYVNIIRYSFKKLYTLIIIIGLLDIFIYCITNTKFSLINNIFNLMFN
jgi:hypothetical protein